MQGRRPLHLALIVLVALGLVALGVDVWAVSSIRRAQSADAPGLAARAPTRVIRISQGPFASPHVIAAGRGALIGWWRAGGDSSPQLTVVRIDGSARTQRVLRLAVPGTGFVVNGSPLIAADDRDHLLVAWRLLNRQKNVDELMVAAWNPQLSGVPRVRLASSEHLNRGRRAIDFGANPQTFEYEQGTRAFLLTEDEVRPWSGPMPYPNRPRLDVSLLSDTGSLLAARRLEVGRAESFIDPVVRVSEDGNGYALAMIRPGDSIGDNQPEPDVIWLWQLNARLAPVGPPKTVALSAPDGALIDLAIAYSRRHLLLAWELEGAELHHVELKSVWGRLLGPGAGGRPFLISNLIATSTQVPANLQLAADLGGFVLSWDPGNGIIAGRMRLVGHDVKWRWRWLFAVRHVLYLQPPLADTISRGKVTAIWQDPGEARSPQQVGEAPVELGTARLG